MVVWKKRGTTKHEEGVRVKVSEKFRVGRARSSARKAEAGLGGGC